MPRGTRIGIGQIVGAAIDVADQEGLDRLTMARVGKVLGVEAMALYRHVPSKDALLDAVAGQLIGQIAFDDSDDDWERATRTALQSVRDLARRHPTLFVMALERSPGMLAEERLIERFLAMMRREGLPAPDALRLFRVLSDFAVGFALSELRGFALENDTPGLVNSDAFPKIGRIAATLRTPDHERDFAFGLDLIFAGALTMIANHGSRAP